MPRLGITFEEVVIAADQMQLEGNNPTIEKIRQALGAGSNTTISKYLNQWKQQINSDTKEIKLLPPDIMRTAIERTWEQLRQEANADIDVIKEDAQQRIDAAEQRAQVAEKILSVVKIEHDELQQAHQKQSAEKELLQLDLKSLREEHRLLQERYKALDERYIDMQGLSAQHLKDLSDTHKNEITRLEDQCRKQDESCNKFLNEIREQRENERHQYMVSLDNLKVENQKQIKLKNEVQSQLQEQLHHMTKLEADLKAVLKERDQALTHLDKQDEKWTAFHTKSFVADDILAKIVEMPTFDTFFDKFNAHFTEMADKKLSEFETSIKFLKIEKNMETQNE